MHISEVWQISNLLTRKEQGGGERPKVPISCISSQEEKRSSDPLLPDIHYILSEEGGIYGMDAVMVSTCYG